MKTAHPYIWLLALLFWLTQAQAQAIVTRGGAAFPEAATELSWHLDTTAHQAWHYTSKHWELIHTEEKFSELTACHHVVYARANKGYLCYLDLGAYQYHCDWFRCEEGVRFDREADTRFSAFDSAGTLITNLFQIHCMEDKLLARPEVVRFQLGFTMPRWTQRFPTTNCSDLKSWGILGINGQWLIAPQYDRPIHFEDGFATVVYYGEKRKINEQGEFVE